MNPQELIVEVLDQIRGMWRYRWWAAAAAWVIGIGGCLFVYQLPPVYRASAQVYIDTNSLIGPLMRGLTATQDTMDEVRLVGRALLARPNLEQVGRDTGLIHSETTPAQLESLVTRLQRQIRLNGGRDNVVSITYEDTSRETARDVVEAVLNTFVEGTIGNQGDDAEVTERALDGEIREHEARLSHAEKSLAEFKKNNVGYMPNEYGDYAGRLQAALANVRSTGERIQMLTERRDAIDRQLQGGDALPRPATTTCTEREQIAELSSQLTALRVNYTERHPRILSLQERIATLEMRCTAEIEAARGGGGIGTSPEDSPVYQDLRIQLNNAEVELAELTAERRAQQTRVDELQRDVDKIASVETELAQLNRDYSVVQGRHQELLARWEALQAKKRLDPVTGDIQFRRIEPPFALADPVGPNRVLFLMAAFVLALGSGVALMFGLNQISPVFFTGGKLRRISGLPILGSVSLVLGRRAVVRRYFDLIAWAFSYLLLAGLAALAIGFAEPGSVFLRNLIEGTPL